MDEEKIIAEGKIDLGRIYLEVDGETPAPILEEKNVTILENGESEITPSEGYDGISKVNLVVDTPEGYDWSSLGFDAEPYVINVIINDANYLKQNWSFSGATTYSQYDYQSGLYRYMSCFPFLDTSNATNLSFENCSSLLVVSDTLDWSRQTSFYRTFLSSGIYNAPKITFNSNITNSSYMFQYCSRLVYVPIYDLSHITNASNMFDSCTKLSDESLDNILQSLITGVSIPTKTLNYIGINNTSRYPASRIQALPHYQDFVDAGWSLGYN